MPRATVSKFQARLALTGTEFAIVKFLKNRTEGWPVVEKADAYHDEGAMRRSLSRYSTNAAMIRVVSYSEGKLEFEPVA